MSLDTVVTHCSNRIAQINQGGAVSPDPRKAIEIELHNIIGLCKGLAVNTQGPEAMIAEATKWSFNLQTKQ